MTDATPQPVGVALVDDDRMLLEGFAAWLRPVGGLRIVATAPDVTSLLAGWPSPPPQVVVLDVRLRDGSSPAANVERLAARGAGVLVVTSLPDPVTALEVQLAGADGYLTKDHDLDTLVSAIETVAAGGLAYSVELAGGWLADARESRPRLAAQERAVLADYAAGMTLTSVARRNNISPATAKTYLDRVRDKYRAAGRSAQTKLELADRAREDGHLPRPR